MNSNAPRAGDFVRPAAERRAQRPALTFQIRAHDDVILGDNLETELGFTEERSRNAKCQFAQRLGELARHIAGQSQRKFEFVSAEATPPPPRESVLRLDPDTCEQYGPRRKICNTSWISSAGKTQRCPAWTGCRFFVASHT